MRKQHFRLPPWRRKPTADEAAPDIADSELVPSESAARPTRRKHGKRTYVIGGALLALAIAAAIIIPGAVGGGDDDGAGGHEGLASAADVLHVGRHAVGGDVALLLELYFFGEDCVEDGVADLVSDLIGMTFGHRLRRKYEGPVLGWDGTKFF